MSSFRKSMATDLRNSGYNLDDATACAKVLLENRWTAACVGMWLDDAMRLARTPLVIGVPISEQFRSGAHD